MTKKEAAQEKEFLRRRKSITNILDAKQVGELGATFKKKAVRRMKAFYEESQKIDRKLPELLTKAESLGVHITQFTTNSVDVEDLCNFRKKTKGFSFDVVAKRDEYVLQGTLSVSPASMRLELNTNQLKRITTKTGFPLPLFKITYYRTLNVRDNYLAALVGGGKKDSNFEEIEF